MLRAVTLDAFGTIIDTGRDVLNRVCRAIVEENGRGVSPEAILERWDHYFFHRDDPEFLTLAELSEDSLASAFREYGILADARRYVEMLEAVWGTARVYPEVPGVLRALDGIPCAVVSNADDHLLKQIFARNGLDFPVTVTSESARTYKPRPRIFEIALEALRVDASDAVHVGDSLAADVEGASRLGMRTVWVNRTGVSRGPADPHPDFEVRDLSAVPEIVKGLRRYH